MKDLTLEEYLKAPIKVQFLYSMSLMKEPVGAEMAEEAIKESPEYFPDELENRRKWDLIPQKVHDEYQLEREKLREECYKDMPPSKGILDWIRDENKDGYNKWNEAWDKCNEIEKPLAKAIHKKYYSKYGIEFNGWY